MTDIELYESLRPYIQQLQELANRHGIPDIFQDNGGKLLEIILKLDLKTIPGRNGNDVLDKNMVECELKTVNKANKKADFTTHHHMNLKIIEKYRTVPWYFAVYENIELQRIYRVEPDKMDHYINLWTEKVLTKGKELNNPKISLKYVIKNGREVWTKPYSLF